MADFKQWSPEEVVIWAHCHKIPFYFLDTIIEKSISGEELLLYAFMGIKHSLEEQKLQDDFGIININDRRQILNCLLALKSKGPDIEIMRLHDLYRLSKRKNVPEGEFVDSLTYNLYRKLVKTMSGPERGLKRFLSAIHIAKLSFLLENNRLEEDGEDWGELMWKYVTFGVPQSVKLPSFEVLTYLCDPEKAKAKGKEEEAEPTASLDTVGMFKAGKYRDLVKLLLIDERAVKEFNQQLHNLGVKVGKYPGFMSAEEKLADIKRIIQEAELAKKSKEKNELKAGVKQEEEKYEIDPNDIELD